MTDEENESMITNARISEGLSFLRAAVCAKLGRDYIGAGLQSFDNGVFAMREYDWADRDDDDPEANLPNFEYKDFSVDWYKYIGRGMTYSHDISVLEFAEILANCLKSLLT